MKYIITSLFFLTSIAATTAQTTVRVLASDIIRQINEGRPVEYKNVEIEGELDLTNLENRRQKRYSSGLFDFGNNDLFESNVEVTVRFTNCTFLGDVLAYYHLERHNETYIAHFEKDAVFKDCTFRRASEFKYSEFNGAVSFEGSTFNEGGQFQVRRVFHRPRVPCGDVRPRR